jgi:phospholipid/cholesterol/gamma-HCH transport system substrate-binding protein
MAVGTNHWKLGLFVVITVGVVITVAMMLGIRTWSKKTIEFVSYFDESVQGLEIGAPVKYRGVTVGRVVTVDIAKDLRHVEVTSEISADRMGSLNLKAGGAQAILKVHPDLRVQLAQTGITGVKFILIDFFAPGSSLAVPLPFDTPANYIPTAPSMMKNLEDSVIRTANRLPEIADDAARTMAQIRLVAEQVGAGNLPERANQTLDHANLALTELTTQLKAMNAEELSTSAQASLLELNSLLVRSNALLTRLDGEQGLLRNAERGVAALGEVARGARTVGPEAELTLREVRGAARSIKRLADALERDPDMLLKGRSK